MTTNPSNTKGCCPKCEKHVRDRGYFGKGQSRHYMTGVHIECTNPQCECHRHTTEKCCADCAHLQTKAITHHCDCHPLSDGSTPTETTKTLIDGEESGWEEQFEASMREGKHPFVWPNGNTNWDAIRTFIASTRREAAEEERARILALIPDPDAPGEGYDYLNQTAATVLRRIRTLLSTNNRQV